MVGLMYELFPAKCTVAVLYQNIVGLVTHEMLAIGADIIVLELTVQLLPTQRYLRGIPVGLDEEDERHDDGYAIEKDVPLAPAARGDTQSNGNHRD
jgi:hypothetical protein